jgi:hypothetical protein
VAFILAESKTAELWQNILVKNMAVLPGSNPELLFVIQLSEKSYIS